MTNGVALNYVFNYTDHLGNIRLSYGLDQNNVLKILEENNYYPFGLKHDKYNNEDVYYRLRDDGSIKMMAAEPQNIELFSLEKLPDNPAPARILSCANRKSFIKNAFSTHNFTNSSTDISDILNFGAWALASFMPNF